MKRKVLLLLGAFIIFEYCFTSVRAAECELSETDVSDIKTEITKFKKEHGIDTPFDVNPKADTAGLTALIAAIKQQLTTTDPKKEPLFKKIDDTIKVVDVVKEWIAAEKGYTYEGANPSDEQAPFALVLWKASTHAVCAKCPETAAPTTTPKTSRKKRGTTSPTGFGFGCHFIPLIDLKAQTEKTVLQENLPPKKAEAGGAGGAGGEDGKSEGKGGDSTGSSSKPKFSKFERTVRTFILISIIATITIVALGFVITILVAIKVFV